MVDTRAETRIDTRFDVIPENVAIMQRLMMSDRPVYTEAPLVHGSVVLLFDMQIPYQDGDFVYKMLDLAKAWGIKQGISGGDFFNQAAFSFFMYPPEERVWHEEASKVKEIATVMTKFIPKWTMLLGNHDINLIKLVAHQLNHADLMKLVEMPRGMTASDYYWCIVKDKKENEWRISHPRNISVIPGRVPQFLAEKYQQNVVAGHGHLAGVHPDKSGKFICIDSGVCCDPDRLDYTSMRDSTRPRMNKGAVILKEVDGVIYPYHIMPQWADWEALKRMYS